MRKISRLPAHIAIVPDGNGRWAEKRGLPRLEGHRLGAANMHTIVEHLDSYHIKCVTLYGFSTENWSRPVEEIGGLFQILENSIDQDVPRLHELKVRLCHVGRLEELPQSLRKRMIEAVELTKNNTGMTLNLAFNYGGRSEILDAVKRVVADGVAAENIDEELFCGYLYTAGTPDVDMLIRTGDELRLSNFLLWQTAYSEYYFTDVLWPDFSAGDIDEALLAYSQRKRRFGGL